MHASSPSTVCRQVPIGVVIPRHAADVLAALAVCRRYEAPVLARGQGQGHWVTKLATALRAGTPNRNRIALQMVNDMLDESTFDASPGHVIPR